jgi:hypothetical protein
MRRAVATALCRRAAESNTAGSASKKRGDYNIYKMGI